VAVNDQGKDLEVRTWHTSVSEWSDFIVQFSSMVSQGLLFSTLLL